MPAPFKRNTIGASWTPQTARDIDDVLNDIYRHLRSLAAGGGRPGADGAPGQFVVGDTGEDGEPGPLGPPGLQGQTGSSYFSFGGSMVEYVQSPTPDWISANGVQVTINAAIFGAGVCYVRLRAAAGSVTARLRDVTNNLTVGTSAVVASATWVTVAFAVTLTAGTNTYEIQLLPSLANTDVNLGSAYMVGQPGLPGAIGATGATGLAGLTIPGMDGEDGEDAWPIPGPAGASGAAGAGGAWTLAATQVAAGAANYDFTGLSAYSEFIVLLDGLTLSTNTLGALRVSVDNGSTFLTSYFSINTSGASTAETEMAFWSGNSSSPRYGRIHIEVGNTAGPYKPATNWASTNYYINTTSPVNALRVFAVGGFNLNSGTIYVFGR